MVLLRPRSPPNMCDMTMFGRRGMMASISLAMRAAAHTFSVVNIMGLDRGLRCRLAIQFGLYPMPSASVALCCVKGKSLQLSAWIIDL